MFDAHTQPFNPTVCSDKCLAGVMPVDGPQTSNAKLNIDICLQSCGQHITLPNRTESVSIIENQ